MRLQDNKGLTSAEIARQAAEMATEGYRVLGLACAELDEIPSDMQSSIEQLTFLGMVGMIDPLRPEVIAAVRCCHEASIKVAMVTGDHPQTAIALAFEPAEGGELSRPSRAPREPIFNRLMLERAIINALVIGVLAFVVFKWQLDRGASEFETRNITLLLMVLFENVHVFNSRSETRSIFRHYLFGNNLLLFGMLAAQMVHIAALYTPGLRDILEVQPVSLEQWLGLLTIALMLVVVNESYKIYYSASGRNQNSPSR